MVKSAPTGRRSSSRRLSGRPARRSLRPSTSDDSTATAAAADESVDVCPTHSPVAPCDSPQRNGLFGGGEERRQLYCTSSPDIKQEALSPSQDNSEHVSSPAAVSLEADALQQRRGARKSTPAGVRGRRRRSATCGRVTQQCGQCNFTGSPSSMQRHILASHNGLARVAAESQTFSASERRRAFQAVLAAGFALSCSGCGKQFRSVLGCTGHLNACGRDVQLVPCVECGKLLQPSSMIKHIAKHRQYSPSEDDDDRPSASAKRPAADADIALVSNASVAAWRRALARGESVRCAFPGCDFVATAEDDGGDNGDLLDAIRRHCATCACRPQACRVLACRLCERRFVGSRRQRQLDEHVRAEHAAQLSTDVKAEPSADIAAPAAESRPPTFSSREAAQLAMFTVGERLPWAGENLWRFRQWRDRCAATANDNTTTAPADGQLELDAGCRSVSWRQCDAQQRRHFGPAIGHSCEIGVRCLATLSAASQEVVCLPIVRLGRLAAYDSCALPSRLALDAADSGRDDSYDGHAGVLAFCGGPVTALDWCPCGGSDGHEDVSSLSSAIPGQHSGRARNDAARTMFLAVSSRRVDKQQQRSASTSRTTEPASSSSATNTEPALEAPGLSPVNVTAEPAVVQLWNVCYSASAAVDEQEKLGELDCVVSAASIMCCLCVGDCGPVWDLQWKPSACNHAATAGDAPSSGLGTLAAACGDGCVRVLALPDARSFRHWISASRQQRAPHVAVRPSLLLCVHKSSRPAPCVAVQWTRGRQMSECVVAAFGDGSLAVWHTATRSPLLVADQHSDGSGDGCGDASSAGRRLYPVQVLAAHCGQLTALAVSPFSGRFVFSGGRDRQQYVWDLEEPAVRVCRPVGGGSGRHRPPVTCASWPDGLKKLVLAHDHSLFTGAPSVTLLDTALPLGDQPMMTHVAKCGALAVNATAHALAAATESGLLTLAHWRHLLMHKHKSDFRRMMMRVDMTVAVESSVETDAPVEAVDSFDEALRSCAIVFSDVARSQMSQPALRMDENLALHGRWVTGYPFASINRLAWSDENRSQIHLLAMGLECGLVRVVSVSPRQLLPSNVTSQ